MDVEDYEEEIARLQNKNAVLAEQRAVLKRLLDSSVEHNLILSEELRKIARWSRHVTCATFVLLLFTAVTWWLS